MSFIRTVCGDIDPDSVERLLMHEHVLFDIVSPQSKGDRDAAITMSNRWHIDYLSNHHACNAHQQDRQTAQSELSILRSRGGGLIVDQSVSGLARDPVGLRAISLGSGLPVVACAGTYTQAYLSDELLALDDAALAARFIAEVSDGLDGTDVRAGLIGEMGCSWPLTAYEQRALHAAGQASRTTGAAVSVHPGRNPQAAHQIIDYLLTAGARADRIIICHMDRTYPDGRGIDGLLRRGVNVEWDFFGIEQSYYWMGDVSLPTDHQRLEQIRDMADAGHAGQLLLSQDICTRTRLCRWGGHGYAHLFYHVEPMMRRMGFEHELIHTLLTVNPRRLLSIEEKSHDI